MASALPQRRMATRSCACPALRPIHPSSYTAQMAHLHDSGYKYLFFTPNWCKSCWKPSPRRACPSCSTTPRLRLESGNYVTPAMKPRADDLVWSVETGKGGGFISFAAGVSIHPDDTMPMRMLQYVAALYDHLLRSKAVDIADGLPPVLPIVLYNGDARWRQSSELYSLIRPHPPVLKPFQPQRNSGCWTKAPSRRRAGRHAAGDGGDFCFEHTPDTAAAKRAIRSLADAIAKSPVRQRLDRVLAHWVKYRLETRMPGLNTPDADELTRGIKMLETNIDRWEAQAIARGCSRGFNKACSEGFNRGCNKACSWAKPCCCNANSLVVLANCPPPSRPDLPPPRLPSWKPGATGCWMPRRWTRCLATRGTEPCFARMAVMPSRRHPQLPQRGRFTPAMVCPCAALQSTPTCR